MHQRSLCLLPGLGGVKAELFACTGSVRRLSFNGGQLVNAVVGASAANRRCNWCYSTQVSMVGSSTYAVSGASDSK